MLCVYCSLYCFWIYRFEYINLYILINIPLLGDNKMFDFMWKIKKSFGKVKRDISEFKENVNEWVVFLDNKDKKIEKKLDKIEARIERLEEALLRVLIVR